MTKTIQLSDATQHDLPWLLEINQANLPEVGSLSLSALGTLFPKLSALRIASMQGQRAGAIFLMRPGQTYDSGNYRWFCDWADDFLYVDRVMVADGFRGAGIGKALYLDAMAMAKSYGTSRITCEINTIPRNPGSLAFHAKMGFREILERDSDGGKRVMMMEKPL